MNSIIYYSILLAISIVTFLLGKYAFPKISVDTLALIEDWAHKLVVWANEFCKESTGPEKMEKVIQQLRDIAKKNGINTLTDDQLRAVAQFAYEQMKLMYEANKEEKEEQK